MKYDGFDGLSLKEIQRILRLEGFGQGKVKVEGTHEAFKPSIVDIWGRGGFLTGRPLYPAEQEHNANYTTYIHGRKGSYKV